jgi:hypothetical protein
MIQGLAFSLGEGVLIFMSVLILIAVLKGK